MASSTNDAVFQRRNKQIEDAIDSYNFKQALQLIEKRMKKGEDTRFLKAWKAHVLFRHADEAHHKRGVAETLELCNAEQPATDLETLDILHDTLGRMPDQEEAKRVLWEKAAKAKPQELEIQMRWFTYAFENDDWKSAQKAAMSLQSNFPRTRKYYFWAIFLSQLTATDVKSSEAERKLFGTLAYRMATKAADNVPTDTLTIAGFPIQKELLSPSRAIQTTEELLLLTHILESQERFSEIVKILDSETLGIASRIVQNDWTFVGTKLYNLEKAEMWTEGLEYSKGLLAIPNSEEEQKALQERDDWTVWKLLIASVRNINNPETTYESQGFVKEFIKSQPKSRNAQLAYLDLLQYAVQAGNSSKDDLYAACQEYFDNNKNKLHCYRDLQTYLVDLERTEVLKFVQYVLSNQTSEDKGSSPFKGVSVINALKLEYCFRLSADETNVTKEMVEDYVSRCLQAYRDMISPEQTSESAAIESHPSDDLCVLAVMCLMRFDEAQVNGSEKQIPDTTLIRATGILEHLLHDSPHNYQALLLLVRIYLRLGAGVLALKTFSKLSVKQFQYETVAHNLFTRLATVHPHTAPPYEGAEHKDFDPQIAFMQGLNFYRNAEITTTRNRSNGLDYGSYVNVEGTIDLQRRLKRSVCRRMYALDVRRIQRLVGGAPMGRYDEVAQDESPLSDQRTFDAFMNCELPSQPTFEERVRLGPLPSGNWVKSNQMTDHLFALLKELAAQKPVTIKEALPDVEDALGSNPGSDMTLPEVETTKINFNILKVVYHLAGSKSVTADDVNASLTQAEEWLNSKAQRVALKDNKTSPLLSDTAIFLKPDVPFAPSWRFFHETFLIVESLIAVTRMTTVASKKGNKSSKIPKERIERISSLAGQVHDGVRANVRRLKSETGMLSSLIELVFGGSTGSNQEGQKLRNSLEKTLDVSALEISCGELIESWEEGLDGMLSVTL